MHFSPMTEAGLSRLVGTYMTSVKDKKKYMITTKPDLQLDPFPKSDLQTHLKK
jgi:hypothetical protein